MASSSDGLLSYVSISGLVSLLGSAGLYLMSNSMSGQVRELEKVKQVEHLGGGSRGHPRPVRDNLPLLS